MLIKRGLQVKHNGEDVGKISEKESRYKAMQRGTRTDWRKQNHQEHKKKGMERETEVNEKGEQKLGKMKAKEKKIRESGAAFNGSMNARAQTGQTRNIHILANTICTDRSQGNPGLCTCLRSGYMSRNGNQPPQELSALSCFIHLPLLFLIILWQLQFGLRIHLVPSFYGFATCMVSLKEYKTNHPNADLILRLPALNRPDQLCVTLPRLCATTTLKTQTLNRYKEETVEGGRMFMIFDRSMQIDCAGRSKFGRTGESKEKIHFSLQAFSYMASIWRRRLYILPCNLGRTQWLRPSDIWPDGLRQLLLGICGRLNGKNTEGFLSHFS